DSDSSSEELMRATEKKLKEGAWTECAIAKAWKQCSNVAAQISAIVSGFCLLFPPGTIRAADTALGPFESHGDVGNVLRPGSVEYDPAQQTYLIGGGGENMWFTNDAFQFVWKKMTGDVKLAANIR